MIDARVDDAVKQHAQKMDWLLMEAGEGAGKVGVRLPRGMATGLSAQEAASLETTPTAQQVLVSNTALAEAAALPLEAVPNIETKVDAETVVSEPSEKLESPTTEKSADPQTPGAEGAEPGPTEKPLSKKQSGDDKPGPTK